MRFDEINIIGEFKINGLTGSPGQALGLSGSEFTWITVSASSIIDAVLLTGTDYVICQSVNTGNPGTDAIENGNRLKSAYATASALYVSNRVSVLITPGDYDFGATPLQLTTTKVDLIGMSSDASDVILRANGGSDYVLLLDDNINTALYNVTLGTASLYAVDNNMASNDYLTWKNVISNGNVFTDGSTSYNNLKGYFEDIKVIGGRYIFYTLQGDIDGIFNNIEIVNPNLSQTEYFKSEDGSLFGTYSNITISGSNLYSAFLSPYNVGGYFENIKIGNIGSAFYCGGFGSGTMSGIFKNIEIGDVSIAFQSDNNGGIDGTFENIIVGSASTAFTTTSANLTGTFSNIEIGDCTNVFYCDTSGSITGSFKDIKIGDVTSSAFYSVGTMSGIFENITLGDCATSIGIFANNDIDGVFENIEVGNFTSVFFSANNLTGTYSNLKFGDGTFLFSASNNLNGYFENISCGDSSEEFLLASYNINGTFKNITAGLLGLSFRAANETLDGYYEDITLGNVTESFTSGTTMSGTFSNIEIGNVTNNTFYSGDSLIGTYENIKIGTCSSAFISTTSDINGYFDTIEIDGVSNSSFVPSSNLLGTYKNIKMNSGSSADLFSSAITNGIFDNIKVINSNTINNFFYSSDSLYGTFSNIEANGQITNAFSAFTTVYGDYKNLTLGTVSTLFNSVDIIGVPAVIDNLKANSYLIDFAGKITNSTIDARGFNSSAISIVSTLSLTPTTERCKFLSDSGYITIDSSLDPNAQISYTITNYGITSSITNEIGTPLNINNSNIT